MLKGGITINPYQAIDVAEYMVYYCLNTGRKIKHHDLHKALFYLQAHYLLAQNKPLFIEELYKWRLGAVVKEVYHKFKVFGADYIYFLPTRTIIIDDEKKEIKKFHISRSPIELCDRKIIEDWVERLVEYHPFDLVGSHHEQGLWKKDQEKIHSGESDIAYSLEEIRVYFEENKAF